MLGGYHPLDRGTRHLVMTTRLRCNVAVGGAVAFVADWDLRRQARRFLFLTLLVAVVAAAVLATVAGARRSSTALERFKASSRSADVKLAAETTPAQIERLRHLAGWPRSRRCPPTGS
jgi:hypothetical protein